jgi:hypothetical protein
VPFSTVTRTPVTRSRIGWPATFFPFDLAAWKCATTSSTTTACAEWEEPTPRV